MQHMQLAYLATQLSEYKQLRDALKARRPSAVLGLPPSGRAHMIAALIQELKRTAIILCSDEAEASRYTHDLRTFLGDGIFLLPVRDVVFSGVESSSKEFEQAALEVLHRAASGKLSAVVCSIEAAAKLTIPKQILEQRMIRLSPHQQADPDQLVKRLSAAGYVRVDQLEGRGQFARRGGILDIYPVSSSLPVRVEFWGSEVDTIAIFDPQTQRRTESIDEIEITPASEIMTDDFNELASRIEMLASSLRGKSAQIAIKRLREDAQRLRDGIASSCLDRYLPLIYDRPETVFDYLDKPMVFITEHSKAWDEFKNFSNRAAEEMKAAFEEGFLVKGLEQYWLDKTDLTSIISKVGGVSFETFTRTTLSGVAEVLITANARQTSVWGGMQDTLLEELQEIKNRGYTALVLAGTDRGAAAVRADLAQSGIDAISTENGLQLGKGLIYVAEGSLSSGYEYPELQFTLITHGQIHTQKKSKSGNKGRGIHSVAELKPGSYVVHSEHGIGVYEGVQKMTAAGVTKDYIKIRYFGSDTLYVPVTQLDLVSKYIGAEEDARVKLNKLGGTEWQKTRTKVKSAIKDMAKELIALYAKRQSQPGYAFGADVEWQREFEERFEFDETDDQLRCIEEIKRDMEKPVPMDRLLCGDVGFGKTEVALRAAFKCAMDGKQCAILVPTTLLAWQHYETALRRMSGFGINIDMLSRFRTPRHQKQTIAKLATGDLDIIIGTHRLLQKDIRFARLGLIVVDEEQRFGVAHKEKLKESFASVDVLTLSATPIPRTLNMALSSMRDMSVIEEAPQDRHPIQTYVAEMDWGLLVDAIKRELRRGGQVYWLHNNIDDIQRTASRINELIPEARVAYAHGQMEKDELGEVWRQVIVGEIDILVCTTIIETGVDVSNVNTIVIENADRMGLSQLHQIRGRVGRSSRRAFAYLMFKRDKALSEIASKRLQAIREFTEFGSGFAIAMRDLEIRGAGNLLGSQQHGHMESVGYDMYLRLLSEAISEEKGEIRKKTAEDCVVDLAIDAYIPQDYIEHPPQRLDIYRKIAAIRNEEESSDVLDELIDRFGEPPEAVKSLMEVATIRNRSAAQGIKEVSERGDGILIYPIKVEIEQVSKLSAAMRGRVMLNAASVKPHIYIKKTAGQNSATTLQEVLKYLEVIPN